MVKSKAELSGLKKGTKPKTSSTKSTQSALKNLKELVNKNKKYKNYKGAGVDLERDADRPAKPIGRRTAKASGKTYYEYRANRIDVKQPPKRYPKLEKGGYMAKGGELAAKKRLEELREELRAERISYGELAELQELSEYIDKDDVELLEAAGVPENDEDEYGKGGKIRSQEEFNELVIKKEKLVKNLSPKEIADMWNKNSNSPSKMTEEEAKMSTSKMYLRDLLVEKELTKAEYDKYFEKGGYMAKGGAMEHGLKRGDTIIDDMSWDKSVKVLNNKTGYAVVHLETGERKEMKAMGGEMHRTQE